MISPENQEHKIRGCVDARGDTLAPAPDGQAFVYGIDESGSQSRSSWWRKLDDAIALVEAGEYDGIVVWKFSRVARHRLKWNVALDRIEAVGGVLVSATEDFDVATAAGRLGRGISGEFNAFQADMIGEGWIEAHERRVRLGLPHSGKDRWGYVYDREKKLHVPHPEQGPVLAEVYARYVAGESLRTIAVWLNHHGWLTPLGAEWTDRALRRILDSGFAAGRFNYRGELHQGVHEPLIDAQAWQAYLDARAARRQMPAKTVRSEYLLSGLIRCAKCGGTMISHAARTGVRRDNRRGTSYHFKEGPKYRCKRGAERGTCPGGYVMAKFVEGHVLDYLRQLADSVDDRTRQRENSGRVLDARRRLALREEDRLDRERDKAKAALVQLALRDAESPMPREVYDAARASLEAKVSTLTAAIETAGRTHRQGAPDPAQQAAQLLDEWDELTVAHRREILRRLIDCVLVRPGKPRWMCVIEWDEIRA